LLIEERAFARRFLTAWQTSFFLFFLLTYLEKSIISSIFAAKI